MKKIRRVIRDSETNITGTFIVGNKYMYRGEKCEEYISGTEYEFICGIKCACGCQVINCFSAEKQASSPSSQVVNNLLT